MADSDRWNAPLLGGVISSPAIKLEDFPGLFDRETIVAVPAGVENALLDLFSGLFNWRNAEITC